VGENKLLLELSVAEAGPAFVAAGLITPHELAHTLREMRELAEDETVIAVMPRMSQVWARKPEVSGLSVREDVTQLTKEEADTAEYVMTARPIYRIRVNGLDGCLGL
jgi:hypothetical protein